MKSALTWFQIPTLDLQRAREFFETVMGYTFTPAPQDSNSLLFPFTSPGVGGALVSRPQMKSVSSGCAVFLQLDGSTADRLFRLVNLLRSGRLQTGAQLAAKLEVSTRTLYRDIADLQASGVMIEGEPGVGYTLRREMDLPPMQFTAAETVSLVIGARMAIAWGGHETARAAREALRKVEAVLPTHLQDQMDTVQMYAPGGLLTDAQRTLLDDLHTACLAPRHIAFAYDSLQNRTSTRHVRPLALAFWSGVWTLTTWDTHREDFRTFRVDRMREVILLDSFAPAHGRTLKDFLRKLGPVKPRKLEGVMLPPGEPG